MDELHRILHVDDDDDIRAVTKVSLEKIGHFKVCQFSSGADAIEYVQTCVPQLCLLDVMMPEMDGVEAWARLSKLPGMEQTPVIFMTAKADPGFSKKLLDRGALAIIAKPFDPVGLSKKIRELWQQRPVRSYPVTN